MFPACVDTTNPGAIVRCSVAVMPTAGRLIDMSRRLSPAKRGATLAVSVAVLIGMPTFGFWYAVPLALAGLAFWIGQMRLDYVRRPEYVLAASWLFAQLMFALAVALAHGPRLYLLPLFLLPLLLWSVAFPPAAAAAAVVISAVLMALTAILTDPHTLLHTPFALLYPLTAIIAASIPAAAVRDIDAQSRQTAVVDQLTGLLNRVALESRVAEISHQTSITGRPVAVILGDIDHFKSINDTYGHARGDEVLREIAARLSSTLEQEPVYRLGGEEFLVLLADVDPVEAQSFAERLRAAVRQSPIDDLRVTMSFGVACSPPDEPLDYERLFTRADAALYRAKRDGRDRVAGAGTRRRPRPPGAGRRADERGRLRATTRQARGRRRRGGLPRARRPRRASGWRRSARPRAAGWCRTRWNASTSSTSDAASARATDRHTS